MKTGGSEGETHHMRAAVTHTAGVPAVCTQQQTHIPYQNLKLISKASTRSWGSFGLVEGVITEKYTARMDLHSADLMLV